MQNGFVESFNGGLRDECLSEHLFTYLAQARRITEDGGSATTPTRLHSSVKGLTPKELASRLGDARRRLCL
jgi:putative transposase